MAIGFVLITTTPTKEREVYRNLKDLDNVVEATSLFGEYDIIAKVKTEDWKALGKYVMEKIRAVEYVDDTKTLTCINFD